MNHHSMLVTYMTTIYIGGIGEENFLVVFVIYLLNAIYLIVRQQTCNNFSPRTI